MKRMLTHTFISTCYVLAQLTRQTLVFLPVYRQETKAPRFNCLVQSQTQCWRRDLNPGSLNTYSHRVLGISSSAEFHVPPQSHSQAPAVGACQELQSLTNGHKHEPYGHSTDRKTEA